MGRGRNGRTSRPFRVRGSETAARAAPPSPGSRKRDPTSPCGSGAASCETAQIIRSHRNLPWAAAALIAGVWEPATTGSHKSSCGLWFVEAVLRMLPDIRPERRDEFDDQD